MIDNFKKTKVLLKFATDRIPLVILLFLIFPFVVLCFYAHPSSDDFNYAGDVLNLGFLNTNINFYNLCFGRYFSTFFMTAFNPLVYHHIWFIKIFFFLNFFLFIYSIFFFINTLLKNHSQSSFITTIILFNFLYFLPSTAEAFYWMSGAVTYILPCSLLFFWNTVIIIGFRTNYTIRKKMVLLLLGIMIIGSNEIIMFLFVINFLFIIFAITKLRKRSFIWFYFTCGIFLIFILIVFFSPGNHTKPILYGVKENHHILKSIQLSFFNTFDLFIQLIKNAPFLLTNIIFISFISFKTKFKIPISPIYFASLYVLIIFLGLLPVYYSLGNVSFFRTTNVLLLFIIIGWFLLQVIIFSYYNLNFQANGPYKIIVLVFVFSLLLIFLRQKNNITTAYADLIKGRASYYNTILNERYELIDKSEKGAYLMVDSITIIPKTIFMADITSDSTYWYTKCYSRYFKRAIVLKKKYGQ
jgi:hypothetical protein